MTRGGRGGGFSPRGNSYRGSSRGSPWGGRGGGGYSPRSNSGGGRFSNSSMPSPYDNRSKFGEDRFGSGGSRGHGDNYRRNYRVSPD